MNFKSLLRSDHPFFRKEFFLWLSFLMIGGCAAYFSSKPPETPKSTEALSSLETFIPKDHLLIPVEITNADKLEGVLGENGIVDLYQTSGTQGSVRVVGRRLRLLRAPLNPRSFAVLLRESEADQFLTSKGPYLASIRPLNEKAHEMAPRSEAAPRIEYQRN